MLTPLLIVAGVLVLLAFVAIGIYNSLVSGRQDVRNAWAQIDVQLKRRHDLIPNLTNAVSGAMEMEKSQLTAIMAARNQAVSAKTPQDAMQAENMLTGALKSLFAVVEAYPKLRSQDNVSGLMDELSGTENKIAFARQYYNDAVAAQNVRIASFSGVLLAHRFGFDAETMFEVPAAERAALQTPPEVRFARA
jgi:LemA protein